MTYTEAARLAREIEASKVGWFSAWPSGLCYHVLGQCRTDHSVSVRNRQTGFRFQVWDREDWAQVREALARLIEEDPA